MSQTPQSTQRPYKIGSLFLQLNIVLLYFRFSTFGLNYASYCQLKELSKFFFRGLIDFNTYTGIIFPQPARFSSSPRSLLKYHSNVIYSEISSLTNISKITSAPAQYIFLLYHNILLYCPYSTYHHLKFIFFSLFVFLLSLLRRSIMRSSHLILRA